MRQVIPDGGEREFLVAPGLREIGFSASRRSHSVKHRCGKAYFAKTWRDEKLAFASIRDDLAHLYSLNYYPRPNPNRGWRTITVKLLGERQKKYRIRTRDGYRPLPTRF